MPKIVNDQNFIENNYLRKLETNLACKYWIDTGLGHFLHKSCLLMRSSISSARQEVSQTVNDSIFASQFSTSNIFNDFQWKLACLQCFRYAYYIKPSLEYTVVCGNYIRSWIAVTQYIVIVLQYLDKNTLDIILFVIP